MSGVATRLYIQSSKSFVQYDSSSSDVCYSTSCVCSEQAKLAKYVLVLKLGPGQSIGPSLVKAGRFEHDEVGFGNQRWKWIGRAYSKAGIY